MPLRSHPNHFRDTERKVMKEKVREGKPERLGSKGRGRESEKKMEIICPPNSWSKTHSTMMESNSIPAQQVSVLEVKSRKKNTRVKRKTGQLTDLPARIAALATSCQTYKHTSSSEQSAQTSLATSNHTVMPHRR